MKEIIIGHGKNSAVKQLQKEYGGSWVSTKINKKAEWISNTGKKAQLINGVVKVIYE